MDERPKITHPDGFDRLVAVNRQIRLTRQVRFSELDFFLIWIGMIPDRIL